MADSTIYNPEFDWKAIATNVRQLTKNTVDNPATYRLTVIPLDTNDKGAGIKEVGYLYVDNWGTVYPIIAVNGDEIDVVDTYRSRKCPKSGKVGRVCQTVADGNDKLLAPIRYDGLNPKAESNARRKEIDILFKKLYNEKFLLDPEKWLKNAFAQLLEFGVAIGQANTIEGERSTAIGQGHDTKSFLETIMGAYAKIATGQSIDEWIPTDFLWTLGNGSDEANRSNAIEVLKSGIVQFLNAIGLGIWDSQVEGVLPTDGLLQFKDNLVQVYYDSAWHTLSGATIVNNYLELDITNIENLTVVYDITTNNYYQWFDQEWFLYHASADMSVTGKGFCNDPYRLQNDEHFPNQRIAGKKTVFYGMRQPQSGDGSSPESVQKGWFAVPEMTYLVTTPPTGHGLSVGQPIRPSEGGWAVSQADSAENGVVVGVVSEIVSYTEFKYQTRGLIGNNAEISFVNGAEYYVSPLTAGLFIADETTVWLEGQVKVHVGTGVAEGLMINIYTESGTGNGRLPEFAVVDNYYCWRYVGDTEWIQLYPVPEDGEDGTNGVDGLNGITPHIGENNNWFIGTYDTGISAIGTNGTNGTNGLNGLTPYIGVNGNWFIGETDTLVKAHGEDGADGIDGRGITSIDLTSTVGKVKTYTITYTDSTTFDFNVTDGNDGTSGTNGEDGKQVELQQLEDGRIYWRYAGDTTWIELFQLPPANNGREVELSVQAGWLCWRYVGDSTWIQLYQPSSSTGNLTKQVNNITLLAASWSLVSGLYEYNLANANITANSVVEVIPYNSSISIVKVAEILPMTVSSTGSVKLYSTNLPTGNILVTINITEATT